MKTTIFLLFTIMALSTAEAQVRDSAFLQRVDDRKAAMMDHFSSRVSSDKSVLDTVEYAQNIFARHLETIRLRTTDDEFRKVQYKYALGLRNQRFRAILPDSLYKAYRASFNEEVTGFSFCRVCDFARQPGEKSCGNCGETW